MRGWVVTKGGRILTDANGGSLHPGAEGRGWGCKYRILSSGLQVTWDLATGLAVLIDPLALDIWLTPMLPLPQGFSPAHVEGAPSPAFPPDGPVLQVSARGPF